MAAIWSSDLVAMLRRLVRQGLTDPEIARRLGISVRSVIGKRHRMNLPVNPRRKGRPPAPTINEEGEAA